MKILEVSNIRELGECSQCDANEFCLVVYAASEQYKLCKDCLKSLIKELNNKVKG